MPTHAINEASAIKIKWIIKQIIHFPIRISNAFAIKAPSVTYARVSSIYL